MIGLALFGAADRAWRAHLYAWVRGDTCAACHGLLLSRRLYALASLALAGARGGGGRQ